MSTYKSDQQNTVFASNETQSGKFSMAFLVFSTYLNSTYTLETPTLCYSNEQGGHFLCNGGEKQIKIELIKIK